MASVEAFQNVEGTENPSLWKHSFTTSNLSKVIALSQQQPFTRESVLLDRTLGMKVYRHPQLQQMLICTRDGPCVSVVAAVGLPQENWES
jgi:hypothetical protein